MEIDRGTKNVWEIDNIVAKEAEGKCHTSFRENRSHRAMTGKTPGL